MRKFRTNFSDFNDACGFGLGKNYEQNNGNWGFTTNMAEPVEEIHNGVSEVHYKGTDGFWYNVRKCTEITEK